MQVCQIKLGEVSISQTVLWRQVVGERINVDAECIKTVEREEVYAEGEEAREETGEVFKSMRGIHRALQYGSIGHIEEVTLGAEVQQVIDDV